MASSEKKIVNVHSTAAGYVKEDKRSYDAGGNGRRSQGWGTATSPNSALLGNIDTLRKRSRHEVRNNGWAKSISEVIVSNVVGAGIKPMSEIPELQELWKQWIRQADSYFFSDFYGLQALVMRSIVEGGDVFVRMRARRPEDGLAVPLQLQVIEAEHCPATLNKQTSTGEIIGGVEFNKIGKPEFYHLYKSHPDDLNIKENELVRVPAENVLHLRLMLRAGQVRGETWLTQSLVRLRELDLYNDAELVRKKTAALYGGFIYTPNLEEDNEVLAGITGQVDAEAEDVLIDPLEPGAFPVLPAGYDVKFSQPADVGGSYEPFMKSQLRAIASSIGITYEQLTGDFSGVNDRIIRASLLEFKRRASMWQHHIMVHQFCQPVWERFVDMAILSGAYTPERGTTNADLYAVKWTPHSWGYLNPTQEISAYQDAIRNGLTSRSRVVSELGQDAYTIDKEIAEDNLRADEFGLILDSDPRRRSGAGSITDDTETGEDFNQGDKNED